MYFVEYCCPSCNHSSLATLVRFQHGDAGIWCCPKCDRAFYLEVAFKIIEEREMEDATRRLTLRKNQSSC